MKKKEKSKIKVESIYPKDVSLEEKERALFWCYDIIFSEKKKEKEYENKKVKNYGKYGEQSPVQS